MLYILCVAVKDQLKESTALWTSEYFGDEERPRTATNYCGEYVQENRSRKASPDSTFTPYN